MLIAKFLEKDIQKIIHFRNINFKTKILSSVDDFISFGILVYIIY